MKKGKILIIIVISSLALIYSCNEPEFPFGTSDDKLIGEYLEENPETFSEFYKMLELTGTISFLKAYGTYTCLAPTNEAVAEYLRNKNKSSVSEIEINDLKKIVRYHIIIDTLGSNTFTDGKLRKPNMYGQYLTVRTIYEEGRTVKKINKYAEFDKVDILLANGILHSIHSVLEPIVKSVAQLIEEDPAYSIFTAALKETGLYDTLMLMPDVDIIGNEDNIRWFTVLAHSDDVFNNDTIFSLSDLIAKYGTLDNHKDPSDGLYLYLSYHILDNSLKYVSDLMQDASHLTYAPLEVITIKIIQDTVLINEDIFMDILEKGSPIIRPMSDNTAGNGVFHQVDKNIFIKVRYPTRVYFDVARQPEIRKMPGVYNTPGINQPISLGQLADVTWYPDQPINYVTRNEASVEYNRAIYNDWFEINFRTAAVQWIEFTTPLIVKGKYNVWMCGRHQYHERKPKYKVFVNGEELGNTIYDMVTLSNTISDDEYLLQGLKRYSFYEADSLNWYTDGSRMVGVLAGTIELETTSRQVVRLEVTNNGDKWLWLDMIQFIPVDENQIWPRMDASGAMVDKPADLL